MKWHANWNRKGNKSSCLILMEPMSLVYSKHLRIFRSLVGTLGSLLRMPENKQFEFYLQLKQGLKHAYFTDAPGV